MHPSTRERGRSPSCEGGAPAVEVRSWADELERLLSLATSRGAQAAIDAAAELVRAHPAATDAHLVAGRVQAHVGRNELAVESFSGATRLALAGTLGLSHPITPFLIRAQLALEPGRTPCGRRTAENFERNLEAFREVDPETAARLATVSEDAGVRVIDLWGTLTIANRVTGAVAVAAEAFAATVRDVLKQPRSVAVFGVGSGQEVVDVVRNTGRRFMGETRAHYLFEKDLAKLRLLFELADLAGAIRERRLMIFAGDGWAASARRAFRTRRLSVPTLAAGDAVEYQRGYEEAVAFALPTVEERSRVDAYYASEEFAGRLRAVARGETQPRVLFLTCRWTTVLQHMCASFRRGFEKLGCETQVLIEESDVERLTLGAYIEALDRMRPDIVFSVSHGRPSYAFLPRQLLCVAFMMDKCGAILERDRVDDRVAPHDVFLCNSRGLREFVIEKRVPPDQTAILVAPSDPEIYHPLDPDDPTAVRLGADVAFMKHIDFGDADSALRSLEEGTIVAPRTPYERFASSIVLEIHRRVMEDRTRQWFDLDFWNAARELIDPGVDPAWRERLRATLIVYKITVFAASYRQHFLEPFAGADIDLRLYGNGWRDHPILGRFAGGTLAPGRELNAAYGGSRILLHVHNELTMHQRLIEGALAGGFFLVNRLDPERDFERASDYFEDGREIVFFDSPADLLEKCRHYLDHDDERREIADRMRRRALECYTVEPIAAEALRLVRDRLSTVTE